MEVASLHQNKVKDVCVAYMKLEILTIPRFLHPNITESEVLKLIT